MEKIVWRNFYTKVSKFNNEWLKKEIDRLSSLLDETRSLRDKEMEHNNPITAEYYENLVFDIDEQTSHLYKEMLSKEAGYNDNGTLLSSFSIPVKYNGVDANGHSYSYVDEFTYTEIEYDNSFVPYPEIIDVEEKTYSFYTGEINSDDTMINESTEWCQYFSLTPHFSVPTKFKKYINKEN